MDMIWDNKELSAVITKSLSLNLLDALLSYEAVYNSRRSFGKCITNDNFTDTAYKSVFYIVTYLRRQNKDIPEEIFRLLPIAYAFAYKSIPYLSMEKHLYLTKPNTHIKFLDSLGMYKALTKSIDTSWRYAISFIPEDRSWLSSEEFDNIIDITQAKVMDKVFDVIYEICYNGDKYDIANYNSFRKWYDKEQDYERVLAMYITYFFPEIILPSLSSTNLHMSQAELKKMVLGAFQPSAYDLIKIGFPAIFTVADVVYPKRPIDIHKIVCGIQDYHKKKEQKGTRRY